MAGNKIIAKGTALKSILGTKGFTIQTRFTFTALKRWRDDFILSHPFFMGFYKYFKFLISQKDRTLLIGVFSTCTQRLEISKKRWMDIR